MGASEDCSEAEVIFNRASLALAKSQRLIASWLPPKSQVAAAAAKTEEELDREESEIFSPVPERLGLGAAVPEIAKRQPTRAGSQSTYMDDKLRKQMLSKRTPSSRRQNSFIDIDPRSVKVVSTIRKPHDKRSSSESEEEDGRTAIRGRYLGRIKHHSSPEEIPAAPSEPASLVATSKDISNTSLATFSKKRPSSYLDEVLLTRSVKRKKEGKTSRS